MPTKKDSEKQLHRKLAVELFNFVWNLLDKSERTAEEVDEMIHAAHASRYHWGCVGDAVNLARGEWQISRVYTVLGRAEPAHYHARRCLQICQANCIGDFDLAYAYEALARVCALENRFIECAYYLKKARAAGEMIADSEDREQFFRDLATITVEKQVSTAE